MMMMMMMMMMITDHNGTDHNGIRVWPNVSTWTMVESRSRSIL